MNEPGTHKLTEALKGHEPDKTALDGPTAEPTGPGSTPREVAEETRRQQEARDSGRPDREDHLTNIGRADQTHG